MLTLYLGALGSSKTLNAVRYMSNDNSGLITYTNIIVKGKQKNVVFKHPKTILKQETYTENNKEKKRFVFNSEEWLKLKKPLNIIWDEIQFIADSRNSQTAMNKVTSEFVSMARRIIGYDKYGYGDFIFIAQRLGTIDVRIRELITTVVYHVLHWTITCEHCGYCRRHSSEKFNVKECPNCYERRIVKSNIYSERYFFKNTELFMDWYLQRVRSYYKHDYIMDIADYFFKYDTLQYIRYS